MTTETDLLPCPFCGLDVTDDEGCFPLNRERTRWEVRCGNPSCFAHDPCDESMQAAVARWNRRATTARDAEIEAMRAEVERVNSWNERVSVCRDHVDDIVDGPCVICTLAAAEDRAARLEEALRAEVSAVKESLSADLRAMRAERERAMEARQLISGDLATAESRADKLEEALKEIRSRSSINLAMRSDPFELTARLGDIHQIADAALSKENSND